MLAVGTFMFGRNWMGGGDVKLLAAGALWCDFSSGLKMLVAVALAGGLETILILMARKFDWSDRTLERVEFLRRRGRHPLWHCHRRGPNPRHMVAPQAAIYLLVLTLVRAGIGRAAGRRRARAMGGAEPGPHLRGRRPLVARPRQGPAAGARQPVVRRGRATAWAVRRPAQPHASRRGERHADSRQDRRSC